MNDDFYIGWENRPKRETTRLARYFVWGLLCLVLGMAVLLAAEQRLIGPGIFEWGHFKSVAGVLQAKPYPHLLVPRPGVTGDEAAFSSYYLVAPWKYGLAEPLLAKFDGKWVTLQGTLIYRENQTLIEVQPETIQAKDSPYTTNLPAMQSLGRQTLTGEIVDSKCFLGVMNPGQLAPHRACAIRCISGGCPPVLVVQPTNAASQYFLLVSANGEPVNQQVLDLVAEPVRITGEVERQGDLRFLRADPATYQRLR